MRYNSYRYLVIGMFLMLLLFGTYIGCKYIIKLTNKDKIADESITAINDDNTEEVKKDVNIYEDTDVTVIYEDFYSLCSETIKKENVYYSTNVERVKQLELNNQKINNLDYSIVEEDADKLIFKRTISNNCPNHFKVKLESDDIIVYRKINDKELEIYRKIDIPVELIREELKERLEKRNRCKYKR